MTLTLPTLTREEAAAQGYVSVTTFLNKSDDPAIIRSMEDAMKGIDAVWITGRSSGRDVIELGRPKSSVKVEDPEERERFLKRRSQTQQRAASN